MKFMLLVLSASAILLTGASSYASDLQDPSEVEVIDPYVEMYSGPGRGYPIFYVIEQGEKVAIITRRPGWFEVKTHNGKTGWTTAGQLSRTVQSTGEPADLPTVSHGDYLKNKFRVGFSSGEFVGGEIKNSEMFTGTLGYRPFSWLGIEGEAGKFFGSDIKGSLQSINFVVEPFSQWLLSPTLILGHGKIGIETQPKLVPLQIANSNFNQYGLGFNYYIGRNFIFNANYHTYAVSTDKKDENLKSWTIGFNTFF